MWIIYTYTYNVRVVYRIRLCIKRVNVSGAYLCVCTVTIATRSKFRHPQMTVFCILASLASNEWSGVPYKVSDRNSIHSPRSLRVWAQIISTFIDTIRSISSPSTFFLFFLSFGWKIFSSADAANFSATFLYIKYLFLSRPLITNEPCFAK